MNAAPASLLGLRQVRLLQGLPDARLAEVAARCSWRHVEAGQGIVSRNSADRDVYFVVSGHVRVTTFAASGRQVTFRDEAAGEMFGELSAIDGVARSADVIALDSVLIASLPPAAFRELLAAEPLVLERILQRLAGLVRLLSDRVIDLSTLGVQNRVHAELLRLARLTGEPGARVRLDPGPKHVDIASQVSTTREQVTREISLLVKDGVAERDGNALVLLDVPRLARMVEDVRLQS